MKRMDAGESTGAQLIPVRMVNEVVYCPRLAWLEWVQGEFADNDFTVHGRSVHRRVDVEGGKVDLPMTESGDGSLDDAEPTAPAASDSSVQVARSLLLSSEDRGIITRIDRLETLPDGTVVPVDTKRGQIPQVEQQAHDPERVQLCAQGLILRDAGYRCDHGIIWFAGSNRRIPVPFDDDLVRLTTDTIAEARTFASRTEPPPPLIDSPKCVGCSLAPICLPDETNLLAGRHTGKVRPFAAPRPDARPMHVTEPGAKLGKSGDTLQVKLRGSDKPVATVRLIDVSSIHLIGNSQITTQAMHAAFERDIPVLFTSSGGWLTGIAHGNGHRNIDLRRAQFRHADDAAVALSLSRTFVDGKIRNQRTQLRRNHREKPAAALAELTRLAGRAKRASSMETLLGIEGSAARTYFAQFNGALRPPSPAGQDKLATFDLNGRNRRPPRDPVNALLSYAYSLLVRDCTLAVLAAGFDPYLGFFHQP
ncbi:MAG: CRISPR-associated endonuclease Cas1, partial [Planctomycetota bacterium]